MREVLCVLDKIPSKTDPCFAQASIPVRATVAKGLGLKEKGKGGVYSMYRRRVFEFQENDKDGENDSAVAAEGMTEFPLGSDQDDPAWGEPPQEFVSAVHDLCRDAYGPSWEPE